MNRRRVLKICLTLCAVLAVVAGLYTLVWPTAFWRLAHRVPLPNGYSLAPVASNRFAILDSKGRETVPAPLSEIQVAQQMVYGFLPGNPYRHFVLNTTTSELEVFEDYENFSRFLRSNCLPTFSSGNSFTYWDVMEKNPKLNR